MSVFNSETSPLQQRPRHQHDCDCCHFLGRFENGRGEADLYAHTQGPCRTLIARYGSHGSDYSSGSGFSYGINPDLTEARRRAQDLGLWDYDVYEALFHATSQHPDCFEELKRALPFTVEYQAYLAAAAGNVERHQGLILHLWQHRRVWDLRYRPQYAPSASLEKVQDNVRQVVSAYRQYSGMDAYKDEVLQTITDFAWHELNVTSAQQYHEELQAA